MKKISNVEDGNIKGKKQQQKKNKEDGRRAAVHVYEYKYDMIRVVDDLAQVVDEKVDMTAAVEHTTSSIQLHSYIQLST